MYPAIFFCNFGRTQLRFCRRNTPNAQACTHLICPSPVGDKYLGAVKWNLPAVKAAWLMDCAKEGRRLSEKPYLVGDTKGMNIYYLDTPKV